MHSRLLLLTFFLLALAGCSAGDIPLAEGTSMQEIDCAVDVSVDELNSLFSPLGLTEPFVLVSGDEYECTFAAGLSPNNQVTLSIDVYGTSSEERVADLFAANAAFAADSSDWNQDLGFGSGWYGMQTPLTSIVHLQAILSTGQTVTLAATYYGESDLVTLGEIAGELAVDLSALLV